MNGLRGKYVLRPWCDCVRPGNISPAFWAFPQRTVPVLLFGLLFIGAIGPVTLGDQEKGSNGPPVSVDKKAAWTDPNSPIPSQDQALKRQIEALKNEQLQLVEQVLKEFPDNDQAYILAGHLHRRLGQTHVAVTYWEKALQINPRSADIHNQIGWVALEKGDFAKAIASWRRVLEIQPRMTGVHQAMAQSLMGLGDYDGAVRELNEELKLAPQSARGHFMLGQAHLKMDRYDQARACYQKAIQIKPDYTNAYYGLFSACKKLHQADQAQKYLAVFRDLKTRHMSQSREERSAREDLDLMRESAITLFSFAEKLYTSKRRANQMEKLLRRTVALDPKNLPAHRRLAALYQATNRLDQASECCRILVELEPGNPENHLALGSLTLRNRQFNEAQKAFQKVIDLAPDKSTGYREMARLFLMIDYNHAQALTLARQAAALEVSADNYYLLAWASDKNRDKPAALAAVQKALALQPDHRPSRQLYEYLRKTMP